MDILNKSGEVILSIPGNSLQKINLNGINLEEADLERMDLRGVDLRGANLTGANLWKANLEGANLKGTNLWGADLSRANLTGAKLWNTNLTGANLWRANLRGADLWRANLEGATLEGATLTGANLRWANLTEAKGLVKLMGVQPGNKYWKRFDKNLNNNDYQFKVGLNTLRPGEIFEADERVLCSHPGFHFASRSWCATHYETRPLEALIQIPEDAQINEPWATDGKASADKIIILQVFDASTGSDVTDQYRRDGDEPDNE